MRQAKGNGALPGMERGAESRPALRRRDKGIVLIITLATVLIVTILANIILTVIASNYKITQHKTSRIQAYYAAMAAMNLAMDKIRRGEWTEVNSPYSLCQSGCTVNDPDIPYRVNIGISAEGANGLRTITMNVVDYN